MPIRLPCRILAVSLVLTGFATACSSVGIEGKYYNTTAGAFAFELKGGKVLNAQGAVDELLMKYTVRGDSLFIAPPGVEAGQALALGIKGDGVLDSGIGSLKKR
jgi:hypothetical protein